MNRPYSDNAQLGDLSKWADTWFGDALLSARGPNSTLLDIERDRNRLLAGIAHVLVEGVEDHRHEIQLLSSVLGRLEQASQSQRSPMPLKVPDSAYKVCGKCGIKYLKILEGCPSCVQQKPQRTKKRNPKKP